MAYALHQPPQFRVPRFPYNPQAGRPHDWSSFEAFRQSNQTEYHPTGQVRRFGNQVLQQKGLPTQDAEDLKPVSLPGQSSPSPIIRFGSNAAAAAINAARENARPGIDSSAYNTPSLTPSGPQALIDTPRGPKVVSTGPTAATVDQAFVRRFGSPWMTASPAERANMLRGMPVNRTGAIVAAPSDNAYGVQGLRDTGTGVLEGRNPGAGMVTANVVDAAGNVVGRDAANRYGSGHSTFTPEDIARSQAAQAAYQRQLAARQPGQEFAPPVAAAPVPAAAPQMPVRRFGMQPIADTARSLVPDVTNAATAASVAGVTRAAVRMFGQPASTKTQQLADEKTAYAQDLQRREQEGQAAQAAREKAVADAAAAAETERIRKVREQSKNIDPVQRQGDYRWSAGGGAAW